MTIISTPSGASVSIDGNIVGVTPVTGAQVSAGTAHTIQITLAGYQSYSTTVTVSDGEDTSVDATLSPKATPTPTPTPTTPATTIPTTAVTTIPTTAATTVATTVPTTVVPTTTQTTVAPTQIGGGVGWYQINANVNGATASFDSLSSGCTITDGSCTIPYYVTSTPFNTLTVQKPGYTTYTSAVTAWPVAGQTVNMYATLNPVQSYGTITVNSAPSGAVATLDGLTWQYTPCTFSQVTAGTNHAIQVSQSGYQTATTTVYVSANQNTPVSITLTPNPAQAGSLNVQTSPAGADIYVDGQYRGYSPSVVSGLTPGTHSLRLQLSGYDEYTGTVTIYSNQRTQFSWAFTPLPSTVGSLQVASTPSGASVFLDGSYMGLTPSGDYLDLTSILPGSHTLTLQLAGYTTYTQTVQITSGGVATVNAALVSSGQSSGTGGLTISSQPAGAEMYLDNVFQGVTPLTLSGISPGSHTVLLTMNGYSDSQMTVNVVAGQVTPLAMTLAENTATPTKKSPLGLASVLVALGGIGILAYRKRN